MSSLQAKQDRNDFIRELVRLSIADDYENLEVIVPDVTTRGRDRGIALSRDEIVAAIQTLICEGYAQAYLLSPRDPHVTPVSFDPERVDELYYLLTPARKKTLQIRQTEPCE